MAFTDYSPFVVDHTKVGASDSSNFPVGIIVTDARFKTIANGGHVANASGFDLRPYADTAHTSALTYELVFYDAVNGIIEMWASVPTLSHTVDTPIYLFYGDAGITTDGSSSSTWDANFKGVYHFPDGSSLNTNDSTANAHAVSNAHSTGASAGKIDGGASFNGSTNYLDYGDVNDFDFGSSAFTVSFWAKGSGVNVGVVTKDTNAGTGNGLYIFINGGGSFSYFSGAGQIPAGAASSSVFHRCDFVRAAGGITPYYDGVAQGTGGDARTFANATSFVVGAFSGGVSPMTGVIDELRISTTARSASWVTADYNNGNSPSTFAVMGTEVPIGGAGRLFTRGDLSGLGGFGPFFQNRME